MTNSKAPVAHDLPYRMIFAWGLGTLPMAIYFNAFNILALRFFVDVVGLTAAAAGGLIAISKLYDAVSDPVMGVISDRTKTKMGRRRPYLLLGGLGCAVSLWGLFSIPAGLPIGTATTYVTIAIFVYATCYTIYNIPYMAMPSEITQQSATRGAMMSWRVAFIGLGGLTAGALGPKIVEWAGGESVGHATMGLILGGLILGTAVAVFFLTSGVPDAKVPKQTNKISWAERIKTVASNTPFLLLLGIKLFQLIGVAISAATLAFLTVWVLGRGYGDLGTIILFSTLGQIIGTPIWLRVSRTIGKKKCFLLSAVLFSAMSMTWLLATPAEAEWITYVRVFLKGLATGGILLVSQALLPDTIEYDRLRTGMRREGVLSGMYTTIEKVSFAIGTAITGIYLDMMGYIPRLGAGQGEQPESAITAIYYCQSIIPTILMAGAMVLMVLFKLDDDRLDEMRKTSLEVPPEPVSAS